MKNISMELQNHLASEVTTMATCWRLTLADASVIGFTDHDGDINFESVIYNASSGFEQKEHKNTTVIANDSSDFAGLLKSQHITDNDILAGIYDYARIEVFQVNYEDLTQGKLIIRSGWLGEITIAKNGFAAEINGVSQKLSRTIGQLYSPLCRAILGDEKCNVNLTPFSVNGSITAVTNNHHFADSARAEENGYFNFGKITFTSGNNNGLSMEVKEYISGGIKTFLPMIYDVEIGDNYTLIAGCDKSFSVCKTTFNNALNFRAEPHIPSMDEILKTAATR